MCCACRRQEWPRVNQQARRVVDRLTEFEYGMRQTIENSCHLPEDDGAQGRGRRLIKVTELRHLRIEHVWVGAAS